MTLLLMGAFTPPATAQQSVSEVLSLLLTSWVAGHTSSAVSFDGSSGFSTVGSLPYVANWTISGWVRSPNAPAATNYSGPIHRENNFQINWNHVNPAFRGAAAACGFSG